MKTELLEKFVIRKATQADTSAIAALTKRAYEKYIPLLGRKPQPMTADYGQMIAEHSLWVLEVADQLAGVLVLHKQSDHLLIYSVAIDPAQQGRGFGRQLLNWAEKVARLAGYSLIRLYTNAKMTENIVLYQRLGYAETDREPYLGSTVVHMAKQLLV